MTVGDHMLQRNADNKRNLSPYTKLAVSGSGFVGLWCMVSPFIILYIIFDLCNIFYTDFNLALKANKIETSFDDWVVCHLTQYIFTTGIHDKSIENPKQNLQAQLVKLYMCANLPEIRPAKSALVAKIISLGSPGMFLLLLFIFDKVNSFMHSSYLIYIQLYNRIYIIAGKSYIRNLARYSLSLLKALLLLNTIVGL